MTVKSLYCYYKSPLNDQYYTWIANPKNDNHMSVLLDGYYTIYWNNMFGFKDIVSHEDLFKPYKRILHFKKIVFLNEVLKQLSLLEVDKNSRAYNDIQRAIDKEEIIISLGLTFLFSLLTIIALYLYYIVKRKKTNGRTVNTNKGTDNNADKKTNFDNIIMIKQTNDLIIQIDKMISILKKINIEAGASFYLLKKKHDEKIEECFNYYQYSILVNGSDEQFIKTYQSYFNEIFEAIENEKKILTALFNGKMIEEARKNKLDIKSTNKVSKDNHIH